MNGFEVQLISGKGLGMIATKNFEIGDTILEEEPFVSRQFSWNNAYGYAACDHCLRPLETAQENVERLSGRNFKKALPYPELDPTVAAKSDFCECPKCKVRYCSFECLKEAQNRYHQVECLGALRHDGNHPINVLNEVWKNMHYPPETSSILLVVRLMAIYLQSNKKEEFMQQLQSFQATIINEDQRLYHKMLGEKFELQMEQLYHAFQAAFKNADLAQLTTPDAFKAFMGIIAINCQGIGTSALANWSTKVDALGLTGERGEQVNELLTEVYDQVEKFAGEFLNNEGSGLYGQQSKINHSCAPNAQSTFPYSNDIIVIKAVQHIRAGEEICISYLSECQLEHGRHTRQKILQENYIFLCSCVKCLTQAGDTSETSEEEDDDMDESYDEEME